MHVHLTTNDNINKHRPGLPWWLAAVTDVCCGQVSSSVDGSRMGDHPGS